MIPRYNTCTIWSKGAKDPVTGLYAYTNVRTYACEVKIGGSTKFADKTGDEFYPASTFWVRLSDLKSGVHIRPKENEMIAEGDHLTVTNPSTVGAETIRAVKVHNHLKWGESESYTIGTNS